MSARDRIRRGLVRFYDENARRVEHEPVWLSPEGEELIDDLTAWLRRETELDSHRDPGDESGCA